MDNIRKEFIKEIMKTLKIEGAFNSGTIEKAIEHIPEIGFEAFHKALFGANHSYLNGMDRIIKVAEQFKPQVQTGPLETKAKELIKWCYDANRIVYDNAIEGERTFAEQLAGTKFITLSDCDLAILNQVKPHYDYKKLISEINHYQDSKVQLKAFVDALKYEPTKTLGNSVEKLQIKRRY